MFWGWENGGVVWEDKDHAGDLILVHFYLIRI